MDVSRRSMLKFAAAGALAIPLRGFAEQAVDEKVILSAPLTHSDWTIKEGIAWGPEGVHHMLDMCKAAGWSRVYWRVLDGGKALYASKLVKPEFKSDADSIWDPQTPDEKALYKKFFGNVSEERRKEILFKQ